MAEAMELDLSLKESSNNPLENPIVPPPGTLEKKESENVRRRNGGDAPDDLDASDLSSRVMGPGTSAGRKIAPPPTQVEVAQGSSGSCAPLLGQFSALFFPPKFQHMFGSGQGSGESGQNGPGGAREASQKTLLVALCTLVSRSFKTAFYQGSPR